MTPPAAARHVVALPYPGRGHINPMLVLCRLLAAADSALTITIVVTEEWHALLSSAGVPSSMLGRIRFATIPNVIPSERGRGADFTSFIEAVCTKMAEPVGRLLDRLLMERKVEAILADTYLIWAVTAGKRRGIPVCSLWTMSATFFFALYHFDWWPPVDGREGAEQSSKCLEHYVPGASSVNVAFGRAMEAFSSVRQAQCVLFTSFYELEPRILDRITRELPYPIYPIGPSIPHMANHGDSNKMHNEHHSRWLNAQPKNSVLYVSFGSFASLPPAQFEEITMGLLGSAVRFFCVARDDSTRLQKLCGDKGLVVPWCDQLKVLCHPSVGGFLSHCGWNSTLEAVYAGVPLLGLPIVWDQLVDGRLVADEWKIGINLMETREDGIVGRAEIAAAARKLMDLEDGESQDMRKRAAELGEASRRAIQEGGSSHRFLDGFVKDLAEGKLNTDESFQ